MYWREANLVYFQSTAGEEVIVDMYAIFVVGAGLTLMPRVDNKF